MNFKTIRDFDLKGKTVLLRADLNVPRQDGRITDTTRIDRLKPTINFLRKNGAKILVLSHFGRPGGERNPEMSLAFLVPALQKCWSTEAIFSQDCIGPRAQDVAEKLQEGEIALLENVRFYKGEKGNDPDFAKELAKLGDIYVNDAFSASHRAHASTEGIAHLLPTAAGLLMEEELNALGQALENPQKPVAAITGGSKISTKLQLLKNLSEKVEYLILGGGMANTFLYACGTNIGNSLCEKDMADEAKNIMAHAKNHGCEIVLPADVIVTDELKPDAEHETVDINSIPEQAMAVDIGPQSVEEITNKLKSCKTVLWNGPMGVFEIKPFDAGTNALAQIVGELTKTNTLTSFAGGGDTIAALENAGTTEQFTYISTAGGAFLEWLEGKTLPGVAALNVYNEVA